MKNEFKEMKARIEKYTREKVAERTPKEILLDAAAADRNIFEADLRVRKSLHAVRKAQEDYRTAVQVRKLLRGEK